MTLIRIGYWRSEHTPEWPDVTDFIDTSWDEDERYTVSAYFRSATAVWHCMGLSRYTVEQLGASKPVNHMAHTKASLS